MTLPNNNLRIKINDFEDLSTTNINRSLSRLYENDEYIDTGIYKAGIDDSDDTFGYLEDKLIGGNNVTVYENDDKLVISSDIILSGDLSGDYAFTSGDTINENLAMFLGNDTNYIGDSSIAESDLLNYIDLYSDLKTQVENTIDQAVTFYDLPWAGVLYSSMGSNDSIVYLHNDIPDSPTVNGSSDEVTMLYDIAPFPFLKDISLNRIKTSDQKHILTFYVKTTTTGGVDFRLTTNVQNAKSMYVNDLLVLNTGVTTTNEHSVNVNITSNTLYKIRIDLSLYSNGNFSLYWKLPSSSTYTVVPTYYTYNLFYDLNPNLKPGGI